MLYLGADHNGYFLKGEIKKYLKKRRLPVSDYGAFRYKKTDDYVDFSNAVVKKMKSGDLGVLVCGSGHGMVIAANKVTGIRAIMPLDPQSAFFGRRDDHANVVVLAAWQMNLARAEKIIEVFLKTKPGQATRYLRRLRKVKQLEK